MKEFGPLKNYPTMRFERVHQLENRSYFQAEIEKTWLFQLPKITLIVSELKKLTECGVVGHKREHVDESFWQFIDFNKDLIMLESTENNKMKLETEKYYLFKYSDGLECPTLNSEYPVHAKCIPCNDRYMLKSETTF